MRQLSKDWRVQTCSMVALFGILQEELESVQNRANRFVTGNTTMKL